MVRQSISSKANYIVFVDILGWSDLSQASVTHIHSFRQLMKSSLFVTISSLFLLAWLVVSYLTRLQPEPRLGRGSLPLSAQKNPEPMILESEEPAMLAKKQSKTSGY